MLLQRVLLHGRQRLGDGAELTGVLHHLPCCSGSMSPDILGQPHLHRCLSERLQGSVPATGAAA